MVGRWVVGVLGVALGLYGLILVVDGVGYLAGFGPQETVHIERTHTEILPRSPTEPNEPPEFEPVKFGDGYYVSPSGKRHAVSLPGDNLKPGMVVHIRHPLLVGILFFTIHSRSQAGGELGFGLIAVASACFKVYAAVVDL